MSKITKVMINNKVFLRLEDCLFDSELITYIKDVEGGIIVDTPHTFFEIDMTLDEFIAFMDDELETEPKKDILLIKIYDAFEVDGDNSTGMARKEFIRNGILTLGDLVLKTEKDILSYYGIAKASLAKTKTILGRYGLKLACVDTREETLQLTELVLSVRTLKCMKSEGITTIQELLSKSGSELLRTPNFGRKSLRELRSQLKENGVITDWCCEFD